VPLLILIVTALGASTVAAVAGFGGAVVVLPVLVWVFGAYVGTEALTAVTMHLVKLAVYGGYAVLSVSSVAIGLAVGAVMILGSYLGKRLLASVPERLFPLIIEVVLLVSGLQLLLT
jgi:uncharacterized membrane protein YfcA